MRILTVGSMYPPHHLGGYELMWESWVRHARDAGHSVSVLASDFEAALPDGSVTAERVARELRWYWRDHRFPRMGPAQRLRLERHNLGVLARELDRFEPDVVSWWAMGGMSMSLLEAVRRSPTPAVGVIVDDWLAYGPQVDGWQRLAGRPILRGLGERLGIPTRLDLDRAARWVFVSDTTRGRARAAGRDVTGHVAHGGIDPSLFPAAEDREWSWRLLYVGRIDRRKGVATAIRATASLAQARLTVVGGGDDAHRHELEALIRDLGVADRVSFESHPRDELARVYADADVALFPVLWEEPWGLVPLEAMSVGRPVIATGTGGSGEYLRDGENCLIFAPREDPEALARAVEQLARDASLRKRLREGGFETAAAHTEEAFNSAVLDEHSAAAAAR